MFPLIPKTEDLFIEYPLYRNQHAFWIYRKQYQKNSGVESAFDKGRTNIICEACSLRNFKPALLPQNAVSPLIWSLTKEFFYIGVNRAGSLRRPMQNMAMSL